MLRQPVLQVILDVMGGFSSLKIATLRDKVLGNKQNYREAYYGEVRSRESRRRWEFIKDFNYLISEQASIIAIVGATQKNLIYGWT